MRKLVIALALAFAAAAAAETPPPTDSPPAPTPAPTTPPTPTTTPPTTPGNPDNASNPAGAPVPSKKWEMRDDQRAHRGECLKLTKQIARYDRDRLWAKERGNELWELSNQERVYRLAAERQRLCPSKDSPSMDELLAKAANVAARLALAAYTHGWIK